MKRILASALLALCASCVTHQYYSLAQLEQLQVGMTEARLLEVMGDPYSKSDKGQSSQVWVYEGDQETGMFDDAVDPYRVVITLVDGKVVSCEVDPEYSDVDR